MGGKCLDKLTKKIGSSMVKGDYKLYQRKPIMIPDNVDPVEFYTNICRANGMLAINGCNKQLSAWRRRFPALAMYIIDTDYTGCNDMCALASDAKRHG